MVIAFASVARSELVWEQTALELHPAVGDDTAIGHFKYQNKGDKMIAIKNVSTSCGCTAASAKQTAEPGEKGEVTATFKIGDRIGTQQKAITVVTDDAVNSTTTLNLKVIIPQVLELQPTLVYWQAGEEPKAKTIAAKAGKDLSIKKLDVSSSNPDFTTKVEQKSANEFRISVKPQQTTKAGAATLTIKPALPDGKSKILYATASVTAAPASTQSVTTAAASPSNQPGQPSTTTIAQLNQGKIDACALLTSKEIESVQGEPLKETKPSGAAQMGFAVSQCYFSLPTSSDSISLIVTQRGSGADARDPKEWWKQTFDRDRDKEKGREEEGEKAAPQKIDGVGDAAFWLGNRVGGTLYVLKGSNVVRISVGGASDQAAKIDKSKKLAEAVLKRL